MGKPHKCPKPLVFLVLLWTSSTFARSISHGHVAHNRASALTDAPSDRPKTGDHVGMARWLVARNVWGVLSTTSLHLNGSAFGNVVSYSDGPPGSSSGVPFFYLTPLDPTIRDVKADARCSLTMAEAALGTCGEVDPESPACAKLTLSGKMRLVSEKDEKRTAAEALFSKHAEMEYWPKSHNFQFYKLEIEEIFLIDWFGGAQPITVADYFSELMLPGAARVDKGRRL